MILKRYFFILIFLFFMSAQAQSAIFYRNVPFHLNLKSPDQVVVNYDFSTKKGVYCTTSPHTGDISIHFTFKGFQKISTLPVILESDQVPVKKEEELADLKGQFTLVTEKVNADTYLITCDYLPSDDYR